MSTAKKRTVKYVAFVASLIIVISYFSLLSPTSAYFYKTQASDTTITFATFEVEQTVFENEKVLKFKGATKLCDTEELLFDEVAIVKEITIENKGEAPARILTHITPTDEAVANGFRYVAFIEKLENSPETVAEGEEETPAAVVSKGAIKTELETLFEINADSTHETVEAKLNEYNETFRNNSDTILATGEQAKVRIIFWSEYDPAQTAAGGESVWQNAGGIANIEYPCQIRIIATQNNDLAASDAVTEKETTVEETTEIQ